MRPVRAFMWLMQIMERHPWLTPDHPDCIAYLWSKVLLFINTWGPAKRESMLAMCTQTQEAHYS